MARTCAPDLPPRATVRRLCVLAAASAGWRMVHLAIEFVDAERIAQLNAEHRGKHEPDGRAVFPDRRRGAASMALSGSWATW